MPTPRGRAGRQPSISDVARRAGVAVGSVSNVPNRPEKVADPTRARVDAAMRVSDTVGLVVVDLANSLFVDMVRGAERTLAEAGFRALIGNSDVDQKRHDGHLAAFDESRVAGVLLAPLDGSLAAAYAVSGHGHRSC